MITFSKDSTDKSVTSSPRVSWTSDEEADTFECAIKGLTSFEQCGSGLKGSWTGTNVPDGKHTFLVRARDAYDNQNEPYSFPFEVGMLLDERKEFVFDSLKVSHGLS